MNFPKYSSDCKPLEKEILQDTGYLDKRYEYMLILQNSVEQVQSHLRTTFAQQQKEPQSSQQPFLGPSMTPSRSSGPVRRTVITRVFEAVRALALCHNVTPVYEESDNSEAGYETEADQQSQQEVVYQASSPDEVSHRQCQKEALVSLSIMKCDFVIYGVGSWDWNS